MAAGLLNSHEILTAGAGFLIGAFRLVKNRKRSILTPAFAAEQIISTMGDALLVVDPEGIIQVVNQTACQLFEHPLRDLLGKSIVVVGKRAFQSNKHPVPCETARVCRYEAPYPLDGGKLLTLDISASLLSEKGGRSAGIVYIIRDITDRKNSEEELKKAHAELRHSHEELKATQLQLIQVEKMESVGRLAAGVAHEVKNPLAIILQGVHYFSTRLDTNGHHNNDKMALEYMKTAATKADMVIRGLVDFSMSKALEASLHSLNDLINESLILVKHELDKHHIRIALELSEDLPWISMDKNKMEQVFVNLFVNAAHAMPNGGTLTVKTYCRQLATTPFQGGRDGKGQLEAGDRVAVAEIDDTGTGIPEGILPKVFDPFFTTKTTGKGTGLGLTVTKSIIELHGGIISIRNKADGGVQVQLMLKTDGGGELA